jgi:Fic family protein
MYIYKRQDWPNLHWDRERLLEPLAAVRYQQGRVVGQMEALGFELRREAVLETLTADVVKTSAIEGESLDSDQVRSSIAHRLGMDIGALPPTDRDVEGVVEMMLDATRDYAAPLTVDRLFGWHAALFPTGHSGMTRIKVGTWRDDGNGPMRVVSGPIGRERIHFEAPGAERLEEDMEAFLQWLNADSKLDLVLKAGMAHLWFVTIHPFDDGNGRIARAITDMLLARSERSSQRFYSMSAQISADRRDYYAILERTQRGPLDVTAWMEWFLACLGRSIDGAENTLGQVRAKAEFWNHFRDIWMNERQKLVLNRLLDGFQGKLTTSKYAKLAKCSQDSALRDISALVQAGALVQNPGGGRSTSYDLAGSDNKTPAPPEI